MLRLIKAIAALLSAGDGDAWLRSAERRRMFIDYQRGDYYND